MSRHEKLIQKILRNPQTVSFEELKNALRAEGWEARKRSSGSSHITFVHAGSLTILTIAYRRPHIGAAYVKRVIEAVGWQETDGEQSQRE